jgi:hypothetical protein
MRQNQDTAIGSKRKAASVEALKVHRKLTREHAESCGENWARCGKLVAIGGASRLRSVLFDAENRVDGSAYVVQRGQLPCERRDSDACSIACNAFDNDVENERCIVGMKSDIVEST